MYGLRLANIEINRKMLSEIAIHDPKTFTTIVNKFKKQLKKHQLSKKDHSKWFF